MGKGKLWLGVLALALCPSWGAAQEIVIPDGAIAKARQAMWAGEDFLAAFPLAEAAACDQDRGAREEREKQGAQTDTDIRCNRAVYVISEIVVFWTDGVFVPADLVTAWCTAAEVMEAVRPAIRELQSRDRDRELMRETRLKMAFNELDPSMRWVVWSIMVIEVKIATIWSWHL